MARMSRFSKTGGAVMKGTLEAVAAGNCAFFGAHTIWRSTGIASLAPLVVASLLILLYGECMARMISTTIRLNKEDVRALKRARAAGHSASELVRKGLRVVASRYYTGRRPPSPLLLNRRTRSWETNPSCFGISKIEWPDHRRHGRAPQGTR